MGKRFTDTNIWVDKPWFIDLSPTEKCAFMFVKDRCDAVGVWVPNFKMANACIGEKVDWDALIVKVNGNIQILENGKWWVADMCAFQYGELSEETKDRARMSHIRLLKKHGLWEKVVAPSKGLLRGLHSPKEKEEEKDTPTPVLNPVLNPKKKKGKIETHHRHGDKVMLTDKEYQTHIDKRGKDAVDNMIDDMNDWCVMNGKTFDNYNVALHVWFKRDEKKAKEKLDAELEQWDNPT